MQMTGLCSLLDARPRPRNGLSAKVIGVLVWQPSPCVCYSLASFQRIPTKSYQPPAWNPPVRNSHGGRSRGRWDLSRQKALSRPLPKMLEHARSSAMLLVIGF